MRSIRLPSAIGHLAEYRLHAAATFPPRVARPFDRVAYAAAHVVADPLADVDPWLDAAIDWDQTIAYREHLWDLGLGVAEAMDTAQRGMGLDWPASLELIRRSLAAATSRGDALIACGAGTDHLAPSPDLTTADVIGAYEEQIEAIEALGGRIILMASRALAACARSPDDYARVYGRILRQLREPCIIHWLGEMFDPALVGYFGHTDHGAAMDVCIAIIEDHRAKVDGIKLSLLDKDKEIALRARLPAGVRMYTGDDFNYAELIAGDGERHSDALLGIFDPIAPAAAAALSALAEERTAAFHEILAPTVPLSRHIFKAPTRFYKAGVVFMAYLNGHQDHFTMVGGQESARSVLHLAELFRLADIGRPPARSGAGDQPHAGGAGGARDRRLMRDLAKGGLDHLSLNWATVREAWGMAQAIEGCARHGIPAIAPWREPVQALGVRETARRLRDAGLAVSGYCRGGLFTALDAAGRQAAIEDSRRALDEAATLGAECLILVAGGLPAGSKDLEGARAQIRDGIAALLPFARAAGVPLAIEPLHPMQAADRCAVNTLRHANDLCDELDPSGREGLGIAIDVYHVWWDLELAPQIARAGAARRILGFHVSDWRLPTRDLVFDRAMMGDGAIDLPKIRALVEAAGYEGFIEAEIFSKDDWWQRDPDEVLEVIAERYRTVV